MVLVKKKPVSHHRRHHMHHRVSKEYAKVYFPYMPVIAILLGVIGWGLLAPRQMQDQILGKAIDVSSPALLDSTNQERQQQGLATLGYNEELAEAASAKARDMIARDYWSHNTPEGDAPWNFIDQTSYAYQKAGENLAFGFRDSQSTVTAWMNSPGHRANILDPSFQEVGFGFADSDNYTSKGPTTVVVAMYGRPLKSVVLIGDTNSQAPTSLAASDTLDANAGTSTVGRLTFGNSTVFIAASASFIMLLSGIWLGSHLRQLKRITQKGEELVLHHPVVDVIALSGVVIIVVLNQTIGFIK